MARELFQKLGMKEGTNWCIINRPDDYFEILGDVGVVVFSESLVEHAVGIHFFATDYAQLQQQIEEMSHIIYPNGIIWISWYKKSSKKWTDIDEDLIRKLILPMGLVDVKVCAVDSDWSGLKLVWRKERRMSNRNISSPST